MAGPAAPGVSARQPREVPGHGVPLFFGPAGRKLFGWYLQPASGVPWRESAVLLCNPFGYEAMCTHRTYRVLARSLAARGFPVLRFDHAGTGDSEGDDLQPGRVQAWLTGIADAADALRARSGLSTLSLFGLRLGGTLALQAASTRSGVESVATWAPYRAGKDFVREVRAFRMLKDLPRPVCSKSPGCSANRAASSGSPAPRRPRAPESHR